MAAAGDGGVAEAEEGRREGDEERAAERQLLQLKDGCSAGGELAGPSGVQARAVSAQEEQGVQEGEDGGRVLAAASAGDDRRDRQLHVL